MPVPLPTAVRCWPEPIAQRRQSRHPVADGLASNPQAVLVFDTETTIDAMQPLTFGSWQAYARPDSEDELEGTPAWRDYQLIGQGLFYADDLEERDPEGLEVLREYVRRRRGLAALEISGGDAARDVPSLRLETRREWIKDVFYRWAFSTRALVVGFNLPFDLSRIAESATSGRGTADQAFRFVLDTWVPLDGQRLENKFRQRVTVQALDSKRAFIGFGSARDVDDIDLLPDEGTATGGRTSYRGRFLDLRTLTFALTDQSHSLASACEAFGVEDGKARAEQHGVITPDYIDYARQDVKATWQLYCKTREEFERHPITLPPTQAWSPASIGKAYLDAMGIDPVLKRQPDFPRDVLGNAMVAYYGGRAECRIRQASVPVVYVDFLSMYPTVNTLMQNWRLVTSERIDVVPATEEVRAFLDRVSLDDLFLPETWIELSCLVAVRPDGDVLPVRARYDGGQDWQIGVNPLTAPSVHWYTLADVAAAKLLGGKTAEVVEAIRLVPHGQQTGLEPVLLRGSVRVDPTQDDFFQRVIELRKGSGLSELPTHEQERLSTFLKVLANSSSYGIFAEMNRQRPGRTETRVRRFGLDEQEVSVAAQEDAGLWCFPPLAASIAGGARLMLAMLECCVSDAGGTYAFCDTDSMAIVATEAGGPINVPATRRQEAEDIPALSWAEVETIVDRFAQLKPYDPEQVEGSILEIERENFEDGERRQLYAYVISAKRYCLYNRDGQGHLVLRKASESALGHLMDPIDNDRELSVTPDDEPVIQAERTAPEWIELLWQRLLAEVHGEPWTDPEWLTRPALSRFSVSRPGLLRLFRALNSGKHYADQVKPFNFLLIAHDQSIGADRKTLVAPFESDPAKWTRLAWKDRRAGGEHRISTTPSAGGMKSVQVTTYQTQAELHRIHPEAKSLGSDGRRSDRTTRGLLRRLPVQAIAVSHIGKEADRLDEVAVGLVEGENAYTTYEDAWEITRRALAAMSITDAMQLTGLSRSAVMELRAGRSDSSAAKRREFTSRVGDWCRSQLGSDAEVQTLLPFEATAAWLSQRVP